MDSSSGCSHRTITARISPVWNHRLKSWFSMSKTHWKTARSHVEWLQTTITSSGRFPNSTMNMYALSSKSSSLSRSGVKSVSLLSVVRASTLYSFSLRSEIIDTFDMFKVHLGEFFFDIFQIPALVAPVNTCSYSIARVT